MNNWVQGGARNVKKWYVGAHWNALNGDQRSRLARRPRMGIKTRMA